MCLGMLEYTYFKNFPQLCWIAIDISLFENLSFMKM